MAIKLGETAPNFQVATSQGDLDFYDYLGESWGVLFSHPGDFTPVCTTELGTVARLKSDFDAKNTKVIAISVDSVADHIEWIKDIEETQKVDFNYPIIADEDKKVSELYGMINPGITNKATVRSVFIISPDKKVKLTLTYPPSTGRNFNEILRVIDSLQLTAYHSVATPADWQDGDDVVILPSVSDEQIPDKFPKGFTKIKNYLRTTPQPSETIQRK